MTLAEFLAARLDEDAATARAAGSCDYYDDVDECVPLADERNHMLRQSPARVLREVAAKRAILAMIWQYEAVTDGEWGDCHSAEQIAAGKCPDVDPDEVDGVRILAAVYSDHPDYQPEWKP